MTHFGLHVRILSAMVNDRLAGEQKGQRHSHGATASRFRPGLSRTPCPHVEGLGILSTGPLEQFEKRGNPLQERCKPIELELQRRHPCMCTFGGF